MNRAAGTPAVALTIQ